jgi:DNA-directed RNA polymerase alpha subunit
MAVTRIPIPSWMRTQETDDRLDLNLAEISIPVRTVNCLEDEKIFTVGNLLDCEPQQLLEIPNFGPKTLLSVYAALEKIGFYRASRSGKEEKDDYPLLRE